LGMSSEPQCLSIAEIEEMLGSTKGGLSSEEASRRIQKYGKNVLEEERTPKSTIFLRQFKNVLIYVLIIASVITVLIGEWTDFFIIFALIMFNSLLGFYQELKAEASIEALKKLTESRVRTMRDGAITSLPSSDIVPGDSIALSEGDLITADIRIFESSGLTVDEATVTGESIPVIKDHTIVQPKGTCAYDLKNLLLSGTTVVRGSGMGYVVRTGKTTYLASIAEKAKESSPESPLTRAIKAFAGKYILLLLVLLSSVFAIGYSQGREVIDLAYLLVAQMVSAIPEGLPLVVTLVMVVGAVALSKKKTLTRYLPSVETLGSATVIASDKTGTITEGRLEVEEVYALDKEQLILAAALCNDAKGEVGDPIDVALEKWVDGYRRLREENPRVWAYPFDTKRRLMGTANTVMDGKRLHVKGAYEELRKMAVNADSFPALESAQDEMAKDGLRVLAFGVGEWGSEDPDKWRILLVGLIGFLDPPKEGVAEAVAISKKAGIRVMMITGDLPLTAKAVARSVGIFNEGDRVMTGSELEALSDGDLYKALCGTTVLARFLPENKYRVVKVLQGGGEIVAVSGDGINDVPALKAADLGIAMGSGTEAAKGVAKMVILDNNLKVIVDAIERGRVIADNIRKVIYYLLSTNLHQLFLISLSIFFGLPTPLYPVQILWINLVTDGVQDKTFPFIRKEGDVMGHPPVKPGKQFFGPKQMYRILIFGLLMGAISFVLYRHFLDNFTYSLAVAITFTSVVVPQWFNGIQAQKEREPFLKNIRRSFSINRYIYMAAAVGFVLQLSVVYVFPGQFNTMPLTPEGWAFVILTSLAAFSIVEIRKWIEYYYEKRKRSQKNA
jgi:Ca2+-transporting ATPase